MSLHVGQETPVARAIVTLLHGATVNRDRCHAPCERTVKDRPEGRAALGRVIKPPTHLERHGHLGRHRVTNAAHNLERRGGLREKVATAAAAEHLLHGAAEIDVDYIVAFGHEPAGGRGEVIGIGSHQLATDGMFIRRDRESGRGLPAVLRLGDEPVEEHFANGIRGPVATGDQPHRPVAVARQRRLDKR